MDANREIDVGNRDDLINIDVGETVRCGEWFVTRVPSGWIYTLKNSAAALGHAVADYHSIFVPLGHDG